MSQPPVQGVVDTGRDRDNRLARHRAGVGGRFSTGAATPRGVGRITPLEKTLRRSNLLVLLGLVSFVLGLVAVYLVTDDDDGGGATGDGTVEVVVAGQDLPAGTNGEEIIRDGLYRTERVAVGDKQPDAVLTPSELSGRILTVTFTEGEQLRTSGLGGTASTAIRAPIPEGFEAVSVTVPFIAGGANTIIPGDMVNVFLVTSGAPVSTGGEDAGAAPAPFASPRAELLLTNSLVLAVQTGPSPLQVAQPAADGTTAATAAPPTGGTLVVQLAVDTVDAEKLIFGSSAIGSQLYLSRVRVDDQGNPTPPVESTPGVDFGTILAEEAGNAFRRSNG